MQWAERSVHLASGHRVGHIDGNGVQGEVDAFIRLPGGDNAALEVTRMGNRNQYELIETLRREDRHWDLACRWQWHLGVATLVDLARARHTLPAMVALCERLGVPSRGHLPRQVIFADPELRWLVYDSSSELFGSPPSNAKPGRVWLPQAGRGGVVPNDWEFLEEDVRKMLESHNGDRHVTKLQRRIGVSERHLFLAVSPDAVSFGTYYELQHPSSVPTQQVSLPTDLTRLWLATGTSFVTSYLANEGWAVHELPLPVVAAA